MSQDPLTKLRLFRELRKYVLGRMDSNRISPERAEEILRDASVYVAALDSPDLLTPSFDALVVRYPELREMQTKVRLEEQEEMDNVIRAFVEEVFSQGDLSRAARAMREVTYLEGDLGQCLRSLREQFPQEFAAAVQKAGCPPR